LQALTEPTAATEPPASRASRVTPEARDALGALAPRARMVPTVPPAATARLDLLARTETWALTDLRADKVVLEPLVATVLLDVMARLDFLETLGSLASVAPRVRPDAKDLLDVLDAMELPASRDNLETMASTAVLATRDSREPRVWTVTTPPRVHLDVSESEASTATPDATAVMAMLVSLASKALRALLDATAATDPTATMA